MSFSGDATLGAADAADPAAVHDCERQPVRPDAVARHAGAVEIGHRGVHVSVEAEAVGDPHDDLGHARAPARASASGF